MKIIQNNPYRIAGILSNSSAKELQKQKGKIKAFAKVGKEITSEFDFNLLDKIERTEQTIGKAFSNIEQNQDKVNNSLFWFLKATPFDETAISYLIKGDSEKATEIWEKVTNEKEVNSKNFSAFNNLGTLKLLSKSEFEIKKGIEAKIKLIESDYFENFVHTVADQTFTIDNKKQTEKLIDELLTQFKNKYSSADALELFSSCNGTTQKYLSKKFTEEPIHNIESNIESSKRKRKDNKSDSYSFGLKLFVDTKDDLTLLKSLLGTSDLNYKRVADELAKEIMQCGIDYFQEWKETKDPSKDGLKLIKYAESIAVGSQTKDRVKENIEGLQEWVDTSEERELNKKIGKEVKFIMKKLNLAVKTLNNKGKYPKGYNDPYSDLPLSNQPHNKTQKDDLTLKLPSNEDKIKYNVNLFRLSRDIMDECKPKLKQIKSIVGDQNDVYKKLSNDLASTALGCLIEYVNNNINRNNDRDDYLSASIAEMFGYKIGTHEINALISIGELDMSTKVLERYKTNKSTLFSMFKSTATKSEKNEIPEIRKELKEEKKHKIKIILYIIGGFALALLIIFGIWGEEGVTGTLGVIGFIVVFGFLQRQGVFNKY